MAKRLNIIGINGSASQNSSNLAILNKIAKLGKPKFDLNIINNLTKLPHFKTKLTEINVPEKIIEFRNQIKNAIEWCVSTTVLSNKPIGLITTSASGEKSHEELKPIMQTVQTIFTDETTLLIQGIKGKINSGGEILNDNTKAHIEKFVQLYNELNEKPAGNNMYEI